MEAVRLSRYGFAPTPQDREISRGVLEFMKRDHVFLCVDEKDRPLATSTVIPMMQNVRGKPFKMGGVAAVVTYPEHRRKGLVKDLMLAMFKNMKDNRLVFSTLYPFRESFYGKFGYAVFPQVHFVKIDPNSVLPFLRHQVTGRVERRSMTEFCVELASFLEDVMHFTHGMGLVESERIAKWLQLFTKEWVVLASVHGNIVGALTYTITAFRGEMRVNTFFHKNVEGRNLLLQYLAKHVDQVSTIRLVFPSQVRPETWYEDFHPRVETRDWVASPMGRIINVECLSGMAMGNGKVVIKVIDHHCPWNQKSYLLDARDGILEVHATKERPQCTMDIKGLSALVYMGLPIQELEWRGLVSIPDSIKNEIQKMFPPTSPFLYSKF